MLDPSGQLVSSFLIDHVHCNYFFIAMIYRLPHSFRSTYVPYFALEDIFDLVDHTFDLSTTFDYYAPS
jgi:hypothetical protein